MQKLEDLYNVDAKLPRTRKLEKVISSSSRVDRLSGSR